MDILAIVGSLRKESYNLQLAQSAQKYLKDAHPDIHFEILDWKDVPLFNQDHENPAPKSVTRVRERVQKCDGIWLFSPEYNHSIPGTMKNLFDWLSRPADSSGIRVLHNKPISLAGISIAMTGTSHAQDHYASLFSLLQLDMMNAPRLTIPHAADQALDGFLELNESMPYLERQADAFVDFIERRQRCK